MKKKYLKNSKLFFKLYLFYMSIKYNYFTKKHTYSQFGEDIIVNNFFGDFVGTYVDIGCYHPIKYSNTALLHKKGWRGVNIDLNKTSIALFNVCRKNDVNIIACLSDTKEEVEVYIDSEFSALNSMYSENQRKFNLKDLKKIHLQTSVFPELVKDNFDFLNIDCEGNDLKILKTIDLNKYTPKLINIEVSETNKEEIYEYLSLYGYNIFDIKSVSHIFKRNDKKKGQ